MSYHTSFWNLHHQMESDRAQMNNFFKQQNVHHQNVANQKIPDLGEYDEIVLFSFCGVLIVIGVVFVVGLILL